MARLCVYVLLSLMVHIVCYCLCNSLFVCPSNGLFLCPSNDLFICPGVGTIGETITMYNVSSKDAGTYICVASNGVAPNSSRWMDVKVYCTYIQL